MPARNATIEDLKKSYSYYVQPFEDEQMKTTTVCKDCDERISLYDGHVCRKYSEKYSDRTDSGWWNADGTYIPRDRSKFYQFGYSWHDHLTNPVVQPAIDAMNKIPVHIKQEPIDYDFVSQIQKLMGNEIRISQEFLAKELGLDIAEEKQKIQEEKRNYVCPECRENENICDCKKYHIEKYKEEMNGRVVEAMEKDKFADGKATYSGTLNKCSMDLAAIKQLAGIDWGKENSQSIGTVNEYWLKGSVGIFPMNNNWENHPTYLELRKITIDCIINDRGKITGSCSEGTQIYDFLENCKWNKCVRSLTYSQNSQGFQFGNRLKFEIQLVEYITEPIPKMIYEIGSDKPFYEQCAVCNQCDEWDQYKPKTENYTCQKCWSR